MKNLEKIISYLDNEMIGEEKQLFEKELNIDLTLTEQLSLTKEIDSVLADEEYRSFTGVLKKVHAAYRSEEAGETPVERNPKGRGGVKIRWQYASAAAVALLLIMSALAYKYLSVPFNEKLYKEYYSKYEANILTRSESNNNSILVDAIQLYDRGRYSEAIHDFKDILKSDTSNTAVHFFLGVSYMEIHNYKGAIKNLQFVINQNDTVFVEHAQWYLALCYIKTRQLKIARHILTKIATSRNFYQIKATDLLKKLKA